MNNYYYCQSFLTEQNSILETIDIMEMLPSNHINTVGLRFCVITNPAELVSLLASTVSVHNIMLSDQMFTSDITIL